MRDRSWLGALLLIGLVVPLTSCNTSPSLTSIEVTPSTVTATPGVTMQFTAIGSYTHPGHPAETKNITNEVTWTSASTQMVTVSTTGYATVTGLSIGNTQISASAPGFDGYIFGYANITVEEPTTSSVVTSLSITRPSQAAASVNENVQFTATGKTAGGTPVSLTDHPTWTSSNVQTVTIDPHTGVATALGPGTTTITAVFKNPDGTMAVGTTSLKVAPAN